MALPAALPGAGSLTFADSDEFALQSSEADEKRLVSIVDALDRLLDRCGDTVQHTDIRVGSTDDFLIALLKLLSSLSQVSNQRGSTGTC